MVIVMDLERSESGEGMLFFFFFFWGGGGGVDEI